MDQLDPGDLELARGLLESLTPGKREKLEHKAQERFGAADPEQPRKAALELVVRRSFGPDRLRKYGLRGPGPDAPLRGH